MSELSTEVVEITSPDAPLQKVEIGVVGPRGLSVVGPSAYELAVEEGFSGTVSEWLLSLIGPRGERGASAYQVALDEGFVGSEAAWLASLIGPAGQDGTKGDQGDPGADGADGAPGADGADGADGASAYEVAVQAGFTGSASEWLASLIGPEGPAGQNGADGADGAPGAKGDPGFDGEDGRSAYQVALDNGFVGTEAAWLASLVGADGANGADGAPGAPGEDGTPGPSAYDVAVANGFVGSQSAWLASLVGPEGPAGADGSAGADGADGAAGADGMDGRFVLVDGATYQPRPEPVEEPVIFLGVLDPTPAGLDLMQPGDMWINNDPTALTGEEFYTQAEIDALLAGYLKSVMPGSNVTIDTSDPQRPVISASGGSGGGSVGRNLAINGRFRTNQRGYASAAVLALNAYGFDRWKATTASTALTFTANAHHGQQVTISSGGSIAQVIERSDVPANTYTLSWEGTATGRVYKSGTTAPAYAASPVSVALDGTGDVVVEFTATGATQTLDRVKFEAGAAATAYVPDVLIDEYRKCQRYYVRWTAGQAAGPLADANGNGLTIGLGYCDKGPANRIIVPVTDVPPMRVTPTVNHLGCKITDFISTDFTLSALAVLTSYARPGLIMIGATTASTLTSARMYGLYTSNVAGNWLELNAEL